MFALYNNLAVRGGQITQDGLCRYTNAVEKLKCYYKKYPEKYTTCADEIQSWRDELAETERACTLGDKLNIDFLCQYNANGQLRSDKLICDSWGSSQKGFNKVFDQINLNFVKNWSKPRVSNPGASDIIDPTPGTGLDMFLEFYHWGYQKTCREHDFQVLRF